MRIALPSGAQVKVRPVDAVLLSSAPLDADGLVIPIAALQDPRVLRGLARKIYGGRCALVAVLGQGAERMHDDLDEHLVAEGDEVEMLPTTTWHEDEDAEDVLRLVEQMVLSSEKRATQPSILVIGTTGAVPADLPGLLHLLAAEMRSPAGPA